MLVKMLMELLFWQKHAGTRKTSVLFIDSRFINDYDEFWKMFGARIALAHAFKKTNKHFTEQLTSNSVLAQISSRALDFKPWHRERVRRVWVALHTIRACIRKHNILQFIY